MSKAAHSSADRHRVTPFDITSDLVDPLGRLQFDYIDLYLLHRDDPSTSIEPIVDVLQGHDRAGRIRAIGGSNWTTQRIQEANNYGHQNLPVPFMASSPILVPLSRQKTRRAVASVSAVPKESLFELGMQTNP